MKQLRRIKAALQDLNDNWNNKYWIFVGGGELNLMKCNENGERAVTEYGGMDEDYRVASFPLIAADGGDW